MTIPKTATWVLILLALAISANAQTQLDGKTVVNVYQTDNTSDANDFDFSIGEAHGCGGGTWYRVRSATESRANRKFSILLSAKTTGETVAFYDTGVCEGTRAIVGWVRFEQP